jgi:hypothetical protein
LQCQAALLSHGSSIAPGSLGLNQEFFDYGDTADDDGIVLEFQTPTDVTFSYPSPPKKDKTAHEQAYDLLKPKFDELVTLLGDTNADNTQITLYGDMLTEIIMRRRAELAASMPKPKGRVVSSAAPTSKRRKTHGTSHYSKYKRTNNK